MTHEALPDGTKCKDSLGAEWTLGPWGTNGIRHWTRGNCSTPAGLVLADADGSAAWSANLPDRGYVFPWPTVASLEAAKAAADAWLFDSVKAVS